MKWTSSQSRMTSDAQSKVYDTGRKKPGGFDQDSLLRCRRQALRKQALSRQEPNNNKVAAIVRYTYVAAKAAAKFFGLLIEVVADCSTSTSTQCRAEQHSLIATATVVIAVCNRANSSAT